MIFLSYMFGLGVVTLVVGIGYIVSGVKGFGVLTRYDTEIGITLSVLAVICMVISLVSGALGFY